VIASRVPDVRFLLDFLLGGGADPAAGPAGSDPAAGIELDAERNGLAGHSFGGWTALAVPETDPRVGAALAVPETDPRVGAALAVSETDPRVGAALAVPEPTRGWVPRWPWRRRRREPRAGDPAADPRRCPASRGADADPGGGERRAGPAGRPARALRPHPAAPADVHPAPGRPPAFPGRRGRRARGGTEDAVPAGGGVDTGGDASGDRAVPGRARPSVHPRAGARPPGCGPAPVRAGLVRPGGSWPETWRPSSPPAVSRRSRTGRGLVWTAPFRPAGMTPLKAGGNVSLRGR
jgi:hypothetical protein